jgi:hypothetical protein
VVGRAAVEVPLVDVLFDGGVEDDSGAPLVELEEETVHCCTFCIQLDGAVREEEANIDVSLRNMCGTAISPRLGAVFSPVSSTVAVVAGVDAARSAFAASVTSTITASATGIGRATSTVALGLVLPTSTGTTTPLLAVLGRGGVVSPPAAGAPLLGVQQLALL